MEIQRNMINSAEKESFSQKITVKVHDLYALIGELLAPLSAKQKLIISSRFGVGNNEPKTLDSIGKNFNITRERVRQIEADAISILKKSKKNSELENLLQTVQDIAREKGEGVATETLAKELISRFFSKTDISENDIRQAAIFFLVSGLKKMKANRDTIEFWMSRDFDKKYFDEITAKIEKIFDESKKILSEEDVLKKIHYGEPSKNYPAIDSAHVINFLEISRKFGKNAFGDWGKSRWPLIKPRGVREKATLVLMKKKKPLHFREISKMIEDYKLSEKKVHPQTTHNELIRDKRFVLVGRGMYALREWGFEEGTVKDVIVNILKSAGGLLSKDNIVSGVLKKRKVKQATIAVNLADKGIFEKTKDGYKLK